MNEHIIIKYNGHLYKFRKAPQETNDKAYDRGWYIIKELNDLNLTYIEKESLSHIWANNKYYNMHYE
mgnify:CR=1 FL=1